MRSISLILLPLCFLLLFFSSCKKEEVVPDDVQLPAAAHTFTIVRQRPNLNPDTTTYFFNPEGQITKVFYSNLYYNGYYSMYYDEFEYSESEITYSRFDSNGVQQGTSIVHLNELGYVDDRYYYYDSAGYLAGAGQSEFTNNKAGLVSIYMQTYSQHYEAHFEYNQIAFTPYPVKVLDDYAEFTKPFIPSFYGKPYQHLLSKKTTSYRLEQQPGWEEDTETSYDYQLDENGYVSKVSASDGTVYYYSYRKVPE